MSYNKSSHQKNGKRQIERIVRAYWDEEPTTEELQRFLADRIDPQGEESFFGRAMLGERDVSGLFDTMNS